MLSFEHDQDLMQFLFSPEPQTLLPEEVQAKPIPVLAPILNKKRKLSEHDRGKSTVQETETPKEYQRRINHRDAERKRRQEMAVLHASLRSKLPKEYVQKKSISSDMHGAVNYINHLKHNIGGLVKRRDDLKKQVDAATSDTYDLQNTTVKVECGKSGNIEVILKTSSVKGFPLSKFLTALNGQGMAVVNCTSTLANEALIHVINCDQVDEQRSCDQAKMEKKLRDVVYNNL